MTTTTTEATAPAVEREGSKGARYREQVLDESFFGDQVPWTAIADAYEISLHTDFPEDERGLLVAEVAYPGYQRVRLPRDRLTWRRDGNAVTNRIEARFALNQTGPKQRATHWAMTPSGQAYPAYVGKFSKAIDIEPGVRTVVDAGLIEARER